MGNAEYIIILLRVLIAALLVVSLYLLFSYIGHKQLIKRGLWSMYTTVNGLAENRKKSERELRDLYGSISRKNRLDKLEDTLRYSGLKRKYKFLTTELMLTLIIAALAAVFLLTVTITGKLALGAVGVIVAYMLIMTCLDRLRVRQYKRTGSQMISFINIVSNHARTSDDLMDILERTAVDLSEPLRGAVMECCFKAKRTGKGAEALKELEDNIEYPFFKTIIRNLEIASRNRADYEDIIDDCRQLLQTNLEKEKELALIYDKARSELLALSAVGAVCIYILAAGIVGVGFMAFIKSMMTNAVGMVIAVYTASVLLLGVYFAFSGNKR